MKQTTITIVLASVIVLSIGTTILTMRSCSSNRSTPLDTTDQDTTIYRTDRLRAEYEAEANSLRSEIEKLTTKERENELQDRIKRSKKVAQGNAADVDGLSFADQGEFFASGVAHLDSVRRELTGSDY